MTHKTKEEKEEPADYAIESYPTRSIRPQSVIWKQKKSEREKNDTAQL